MAEPSVNIFFQALMTVVSSIGAGVSAWAAWQAVKVAQETAQEGAESNRIAEGNRLAMFRPHVVIYTRLGRRNGTYTHSISLFISNVGSGAARNVNFSLVKGENETVFNGESIGVWGPIKSGISVLAAGESMETNLINRFNPEWERFRSAEIMVEVNYSDIEGRKYPPERFSIDLNIGENTVWTSGASNDIDIVRNRSLEGIERAIKDLHK